MQNRTFYGIVVVLVATLLIVSTLAASYYSQDEQVVSQNQSYLKELGTALASYRSLSGSFNSSLSDYNMTLSLLATAVANLNTSTPAYANASATLNSLWKSYQALSASEGRRTLVYQVDILVDYGNGTRRWNNSTQVQPGWNGYVDTLVAFNGRVQATWYPNYGEHIVTGLQGISDTKSQDWFLLTYNRTAAWQVAQVGVDEIPIANDTSFAWLFCPANANFLPTCPLP